MNGRNAHVCPHTNLLSLDVVQSKLGSSVRKECQDCHSQSPLWVCLCCGHYGCGDKTKGHTKEHFENAEHPIFINVETQESYCFKCRRPFTNTNTHVFIQLARDMLRMDHLQSSVNSRTRRGTQIHPPDSVPSFENGVVVKKLRSGRTIGSETYRIPASSGVSVPTSPEPTSSDGFSTSSAQTESQSSVVSSGFQSPSLSLSPSPSPSPSPIPIIVELQCPEETALCLSSEKTPFADPRLGRRGLKNLGNTCFMNSVIQVLGNIPDVRDFLLGLRYGHSCISNPHTRDQESGETLASSRSPPESKFFIEGHSSPLISIGDCSVTLELQKLVQSLWLPDPSTIVPSSFYKTMPNIIPHFEANQQQDAQEFLRYLLDRVQTELSCSIPAFAANASKLGSSLFAFPSSISRTFEGNLISESLSIDLSLNIPMEKIVRRSQREASRGPRVSCSLSECLQLFTEAEELERTEKYYCQLCGGMEEALKKFTIESLPKVLCIHIKRFCPTSPLRSKIDTHINFPLEELDMSPYSLEKTDAIFDCIGAIAHIGARANEGHYSCFVRSPTNGDWLELNDARVAKATTESVAESPVYILFYQRRHSNSVDEAKRKQVRDVRPHIQVIQRDDFEKRSSPRLQRPSPVPAQPSSQSPSIPKRKN